MSDWRPRPEEAQALRAAGYVRIPRMWVPARVLPEIIELAEVFSPEVRQIRKDARKASKDRKT